METTMLSKFLYCAAVIVVAVSFGQWLYRVQDPSQLAFGLNVALTIVVCAYIHSAFRNVVHDMKKSNEVRDKEIKALNQALDTAINYTREVDAKIK
jgi:ABC-type nickel/cobalt efflux system permease component RcnA